MDDYSGSGDVTSDEASLFERVRRGEILDLGGRTIHAAVLRDLLLRHRGADIPLTGLRIKNACVDGPLDLADLARPCMGLPALMLEFCDRRQAVLR